MKIALALSALTMALGPTAWATAPSEVKLLKIDCKYTRVDRSVGIPIAGYSLQFFINEKMEVQENLPQKLDAVDANGEVVMSVNEKTSDLGGRDLRRGGFVTLHYTEGGDRNGVKISIDVLTYANSNTNRQDTFSLMLTEYARSMADLGFRGHASVGMNIITEGNGQHVISSGGQMTCTKNIDFK